MLQPTRDAAYIVGPYQEPSLIQTLRNHAHALCPDPAEADKLISSALREEAALGGQVSQASSKDVRIALLRLLYANWREIQGASPPPAE